MSKTIKLNVVCENGQRVMAEWVADERNVKRRCGKITDVFIRILNPDMFMDPNNIWISSYACVKFGDEFQIVNFNDELIGEHSSNNIMLADGSGESCR